MMAILAWVVLTIAVMAVSHNSPASGKGKGVKDGCPISEYEAKTDILISIINEKHEKNIVIFGETGAGKSTLINMISDRNVTVTSDRAIGTTFEYKKYSFLNFNLYDTSGLGEPETGRVGKKEAVQQLLTLMSELYHSSGINLLILVMKRGKINATLKSNYEMFVSIISESKVPVLLVITNGDMEKERGQWFQQNKAHFDNHKMQFSSAITVCGTKGENELEILKCHIQNCYSESRYDVLSNIAKHASPLPLVFTKLRFEEKFKTVLNYAFDYFGYPLVLWTNLYDFLVEQGLDKKTAARLVNHARVEL